MHRRHPAVDSHAGDSGSDEESPSLPAWAFGDMIRARARVPEAACTFEIPTASTIPLTTLAITSRSPGHASEVGYLTELSESRGHCAAVDNSLANSDTHDTRLDAGLRDHIAASVIDVTTSVHALLGQMSMTATDTPETKAIVYWAPASSETRSCNADCPGGETTALSRCEGMCVSPDLHEIPMTLLSQSVARERHGRIDEHIPIDVQGAEEATAVRAMGSGTVIRLQELLDGCGKQTTGVHLIARPHDRCVKTVLEDTLDHPVTPPSSFCPARIAWTPADQLARLTEKPDAEICSEFSEYQESEVSSDEGPIQVLVGPSEHASKTWPQKEFWLRSGSPEENGGTNHAPPNVEWTKLRSSASTLYLSDVFLLQKGGSLGHLSFGSVMHWSFGYARNACRPCMFQKSVNKACSRKWLCDFCHMHGRPPSGQKKRERFRHRRAARASDARP